MLTFVHPDGFKIICASREAFAEIRAQYFPETKLKDWKLETVFQA